ncbi:MAG: threonine/serine dehydratase [Anaerolineales bacterium]|nr:MAG: threonine/serine dehydratase [Anaerolineales bacterium]
MLTSLPFRSILMARRSIQSHVSPTPLLRSLAMSEILDADVWLKLECRQPTGSFKVRGALNKLHQITQSGNCEGVVTGSAGNHGLGVAFAAQAMGLSPVTIVVPKNAPESKKMKLRRFPIELIEQGESYEEAHQAALQLAERYHWSYIHAYDDVDVIAGQGTIGLEILEVLPETDVIVVPVGGGGLIAGIANAVKQLNPMCEIVGIQAAASPAAQMSLHDGQPYDPYDHEPTIADGLAGGFGKLPFYLARTLIDRIELASEQDFMQAVYALIKHEQILAEPSGAISTHPVARAGESWHDRTVVCVISGGNLALPLLKKVLEEQEQ